MWYCLAFAYRGLLQFLDGEVLPLTVGDLIGCLICRGHVEDGVLHLTKGYATIVKRATILEGGKATPGISTKKEGTPKVLEIAGDSSRTDLLPTGKAIEVDFGPMPPVLGTPIKAYFPSPLWSG